MPSYVPIKGDDLCIVEQEIKTKKTVTKKGPVNFIWIYDRSGSMTWMLPDLTQQLIKLSKTLEKGNTLSLGWFSNEGGEFNWVFKGFKITDDSDYKALEAAIKKNSHSLNCTCFSEILTDVDTVIKDLSVISKTFSLHFFTDGYPVVGNYQKEVNSIFAAIKKLKGRIQTSMMIGYGSYYNKSLMTDMAEKLGSILIHSSQIPQYSDSITKLVKLTENQEPKEEVEPLVSEPLAIFTITDQGIVIYSIDDDGKLYINPQKGESTFVYYISTEKPNKKSWDKIEVPSINFGENGRLAKALYGSALVLTQQTKSDLALEILGKIGDKAIIDSLNNAFQVEEYGAVEESLNKSIQDVSLRFASGRDPNYLPAPDAFCVFDVLNTLINDKDAAFYPYHEKFKYDKIGVASKAKEGYSKFIADKNSKCPFANLTWHESHLNLSILTNIKGTIELHDVNGVAPKKLGFANPYPTFVFRNYTFIKDGHTNVKIFFISSSEDTYKEFKNRGVVVEDTFKKDGIYGVDISKLPAINRKIATGKTSAKELCKMTLKEQNLKAHIKALKWLKEQEVGDEDQEKPVNLTDEQTAFLKENGIQVERGGLYSPPTEKEDPKDFYMAKTFEINLSGLNSLPSVKKVVEKIAAGKPRTPVEALIEKGLEGWNSKKASLSTKSDKAKWFENTLSSCQKELKEVRPELQATKFAVILGKKWFDEFTSRNNCELTIDGVKCSFVLGEDKVPV